MTGVGDDSRGRAWARPWFVVGLALAVAATVVLVLADDIRYLRLGIVAALWAALVGALLAVRYRKQAANTEETVAQAQEVYELELEREIAARREYELELESETRQRVEANSRAELDALRAEISALRENLQALFGGEVLLERLSLTAQATRMRALREEQRVVGSGAPTGTPRPALAAAKKSDDIVDRPTELIERVRDKQPARPLNRVAARDPRRPERPTELPQRRVAKNEPARGRPVRAANAAAEVREQSRAASATPEPQGKKPGSPDSAEPNRVAVTRYERGRPATRPQEPDPVEQPTRVAAALGVKRAPGSSTRVNGKAVPAMGADAVTQIREVPVSAGLGNVSRRPAEAEPARNGAGGATEQRDPAGQTAASLFTPANGAKVSQAKDTEPVAKRTPQEPAEQSPEEAEPLASNPTLPEEARRLARQGRSGGRRRRSDDDERAAQPVHSAQSAQSTDKTESAEPTESEGGGRRHRADGEPPLWLLQSTGGDGPGRRRAGHSRPESEPVAEPALSGRRAAPETNEDSGSHSEGRSVSELLAAHGTELAAPRRRRRAAD